MSNYETHEGFPEIRKDLNYEIVALTARDYFEWRKLYLALPNVKVIYSPKAKR